MKNIFGLLRVFCIFHLSLVSPTSSKTLTCEGYSQIIYVKTENYFKKSLDGWTSHNTTTYKSLSKALKEENLNDTCIVIQENVNLDEDIVKQNIHKLLLTSDSSNNGEIPTITCNSTKYVGIAFYRTTNITISNLKFYHCGGERLMKRACVNKTNCLYVSTAVLFQDNINISVSNVELSHSFGYGMTIFDSNNIVLNTLRVYYSNHFLLNNGDINKRIYVPGGGLYLEYSPNYQVHNNSVHLKDYISSRNIASKSEIKSSNETLPFGKGGALTILYLGKTMRNVFHCSGGMFNRNKAISGGGAYIYLSEDAINNTVIFNNSLFMHNEALKYGGGVYIVQEKNSNYIYLLDGTFKFNNALIGGGIFSIVNNVSLLFTQPTNPGVNIGFMICAMCTFIESKAVIGAAMYLYSIKSDFTNLLVERCNTRDSGLKMGYAAVYAQDSFLSMHGHTKVIYNKDTGFILYNSKLTLYDTTIFSFNYGYNGGAVCLYYLSQIQLMHKSYLQFNNNHAESKGGAIYSAIIGRYLMPWHAMEFSTCNCMFSFPESVDRSPDHFNGSVVFMNNTAKTGIGTDIYSSTLQGCMQLSDLNISRVIVDWKNFIFTSESSKAIVTDLIRIFVPPESLALWNIYPGKKFSPLIYLLDERGNHVPQAVDIVFSANVSAYQSTEFIVDNQGKIHLSLLGEENTMYTVFITTTSSVLLSKIIQNRYLKYCPFGFKHNNAKKCICDYQTNNEKGIAECYNHTLYLYKDRWVPHIRDFKPTRNIYSLDCPSGYCTQCKGIYCKYNAGLQCINSRNQSSTLCGKCNTGLSVTLGDPQTCKDCTGSVYNWIWMSIFIMLCISLYTLMIMFLNLDIMSYCIHGFLYSYQIFDCLYPSEYHVGKVISVIIGVIEITSVYSGLPKICIWDQMDNLQRLAYSYLIPVWFLLFISIVYLYAVRNPNAFFSRSKCLRAFTIVGIIVYNGFTRISLMLLTTNEIDGQKYVFVYGDIIYGKGEHLPYFITAVIILIIVTSGVPLLLIKSLLWRYFISYYHHHVDQSSAFFLMRYLLHLKLKISTYCYSHQDGNMLACFESLVSSPFKRKYIWLLPYYFIIRIVMLSIGFFVPNGPLQTLSLALTSLVIFVAFSWISPYTNPITNYGESLLLANITVIGILSLGFQTVYAVNAQKIIKDSIRVMSYVPVAIVLLTLLMDIMGHYVSRKKSNDSRHRIYFPNRVTMADDNDDADDYADDYADDDDDGEDYNNDYCPYIKYD